MRSRQQEFPSVNACVTLTLMKGAKSSLTLWELSAKLIVTVLSWLQVISGGTRDSWLDGGNDELTAISNQEDPIFER